MRRPLAPFTLAVLVAAASATGLLPRHASAFVYPEHEGVSRIAWNWIIERKPELAEVVDEALLALPTDELCDRCGLGPNGLTGDEPCFTVADLPALAADHAELPHHLIERWLVTGTPASGKTFRNLWAAWTAPQRCTPSAPDIPAFVKLIRRYRLPSDTSDLDSEIAGADGDYVCMASHNANHFRLPGVDIYYQITARGMPNAISEYVSYHAIALATARFARTQQGPVRHRAFAVALIYESFALHFLQDSVASGHIVTPANTLNLASIKATHDHANSAGVAVTLRHETCIALDYSVTASAAFPNLSRMCESILKPRSLAHLDPRAVVRGDHAIAKRMAAADPLDITEDLAVLASTISLKEFASVALSDATIVTEPPTADAPTEEGFVSAIHAERDPAEVQAQAELARRSGGCDAWLKTQFGDDRSVAKVLEDATGWGRAQCHYLELLELTAAHGDLGALALLPVPAERIESTEIFSGTCGRVSGGAKPLIPTNAGSPSVSLYVGTGLCHYFPPYEGLRLAMGADVIFYYFSNGSTQGPSVSLSPVGGQLWTSIGFDPDRFVPAFLLLGMGFDPLVYEEPVPVFNTAHRHRRFALSLLTGVGIDLALYDKINVRFAIPVSFIWTFPNPKEGRDLSMIIAPAFEAGMAFTF